MTEIKVIKKSGISTLKLTEIITKHKYVSKIVSDNLKRIINNSYKHSAHTKTRGEVRGGGRKPWKQKGTGRARTGSLRSPIFKGGGTTFGPRFSKSISKSNSKSVNYALLSVLKKKENNIYILDLSLKKPSTKIVKQILSENIKYKNILLIGSNDTNIKLSVNNIPLINYVDILSLNVYNVSTSDVIVFTHTAYNKYFNISDENKITAKPKKKVVKNDQD